MRLLNKIDDGANQNFTILTEAGERISFRIFFAASQQSWFFDMTYDGKTLNGVKVCISPNVLREQKNVFPFGIACVSNDGNEPFYINDFKNDRIRLYLLNANDVAQVEEAFFT